MRDTLNPLQLVVLAAVYVGADTAEEIAARLGFDVVDVTVRLAELQEAGALTVVPRVDRST